MKSESRGLVRGALLALAGVVLMAGTVRADMVLDFSGGPGGSISFNPATGTITGSNLGINCVVGLNTPLNSDNGPLTCPAGSGYAVSATLDFTMTGVTYNSVTDIYSYTGGTFLMTGTTAAGVPVSSALMTGTFNPGAFFGIPGVTGILVSGTGSDVKDPDLLAFFGITVTNFNFTSFNIALGGYTGTNATTGAFTATGPFSTDVANTAVPEPMSFMLLGTAMVAVATIMRRRRKNAKGNS